MSYGEVLLFQYTLDLPFYLHCNIVKFLLGILNSRCSFYANHCSHPFPYAASVLSSLFWDGVDKKISILSFADVIPSLSHISSISSVLNGVRKFMRDDIVFCDIPILLARDPCVYPFSTICPFSLCMFTTLPASSLEQFMCLCYNHRGDDCNEQ